jgi:hypothetical protein
MPSRDDTCPLCKKEVTDKFNGYECNMCDQKFHGTCASNKSKREKPNDRYLRDDIVICPSCSSDDVESLLDPGRNTNQKILNTIDMKGPNIRGGKKRKTRKARKARKTKKNRKTNKKKY